MGLAADLHFEFGDASLQAEELLLKCCFLSLEGGDLLLDATVLCLLEVKVPFPKVSCILHFLLDADQLVAEALLDVGRLHGEH